MARVTTPSRDDRTGIVRPRRGLGWLQRDEGWEPGEGALRLLASVGVAILAVGLKLYVVNGLGGEVGFLSYVGAVALGAWVAGFRGGLLTTALSALAESALFLAPAGSLGTPFALFRLGLFLFDGAVVTVITSSLRRSSVRERAARDSTEAQYAATLSAHDAAEEGRTALGRLQAVTASLAGAATPTEVADAILDRGLTALGAVAGGVCRLSSDGQAVELIAARGYPADEMRPGFRFPLDRRTHLTDAVATGRPIFLDDPVEWTARYPDSPPHALSGSPTGGAIAVLPLISTGRTLGTALFRFAGRVDFEGGTGDLAVRLAEHGAEALDRALAYETERQLRMAMERGRDRLEVLAQASDLLGAGLDIGASLIGVARLALPAMADWCAIELIELERPVLAVAAASRDLEQAVDRLVVETQGDLGRALAPEAIPEMPVVAAIEASWSERFTDPRPVVSLSALSTRAVLVAPIPGADGVRIGALIFGGASADRFEAADLSVARDLASRIGTAAHQAGLFAAVARFKATVDASSDAVFMFDPGTLRLTYVNRGGADLVGSEPDELVGQSVLRLQPGSAVRAFRQRLDEVRASPGGTVSFTGAVARGDQREVPIEAFLQEVILGDGSTSVILTARDISDRIDVQARLTRIAGDERRQAAELRAVIQAMGEGILVVGPDGTISLANEAAMTILGGEMPSDVAALSARLGVEPAQFAGEPPGAAGDRPADPVVSHLDDGRWLETSVYPADLASGLLSGRASAIVVVRDVTKARDAEAAREAFLGVLSHELRTPVTTIFGYAKVLQRPSRRGDRTEMLNDIEVEADRLYRIVEDLLALSRVEGGISIEGEPLLLQHLAEPVIASEAQRWRDIRFEMSIPPGLPAVFGERTYVEQVIRNLVSNAGKYSPPDTLVTIGAKATPTEVEVRVLDRGHGIDEAEAERLFDLYYRSPNTARSASGAGIGLYVGRGLVGAMGGRIWARPRPGGGSEFGFSLPRCEEDPFPIVDGAP